MEPLDDILEGLERVIALEAELGTKSFEFDRSLLAPSPAPSVSPAAVAASRAAGRPAAAAAGVPSPAAAPAKPPAASDGARCTLREIHAGVAACTACELSRARSGFVCGQGLQERPDILFAGDYPDPDDISSGLALSGRAGDFFDKMLAAIHYDRSRVFTTTLCKCRPSRPGAPEPGCFAACLPHFKAQVSAIRPRCIVVLLRPSTALSADGRKFRRGQWYKWWGVPAIATLHPSHIVKFDVGDTGGLKQAKSEIWKTLKAVAAFLSEAQR